MTSLSKLLLDIPDVYENLKRISSIFSLIVNLSETQMYDDRLEKLIENLSKAYPNEVTPQELKEKLSIFL